MLGLPAAQSCVRTACRWPAAASLTYRYETRQVWLTELPPQPGPGYWPLCPHHADTQTAPRFWELVDLRTGAPARVEPAGRDLVPARAGPSAPSAEPDAGERQSPPPAPSPRYAALYEELPRLAAQLQGDEPTWTELTLFDWDWVTQTAVAPN